MAIFNKHDALCKFENAYSCNFCGRNMRHGHGGLWSGDPRVVLCCTRCAVTLLPTFLADSLYAENLREAQREVSGRVMASLQQGLASRAEHRKWNDMELIRRMDAWQAKTEAADLEWERLYPGGAVLPGPGARGDA